MHESRFDGSVAIVTGAGSAGDGDSVGFAIARTLASQGARVVLVDRENAAGNHSRDRLVDAGVAADRLVVAAGDVASAEDCAAIADAARERFGGVDILVNNVGVTGPAGTAVEVDPDAWAAALAINVSSMMLMAKYTIPLMRADGKAAIINISSGAGLRGGHPSLLYPTSKGAVINLTRAMAVHHGRAGVRVNTVAPGLIYTPMVSRRGMSDEQRAARADHTLLGTEGNAADVADAVAFLASAEARWITGVVLPVDGGENAGDAGLPVPPSDGRSAASS